MLVLRKRAGLFRRHLSWRLPLRPQRPNPWRSRRESMLTRTVRLGDDIDDFCVKCKRVMTHSVVSILNDGPAKVRCRTCHSDHDFRNEQPPPPKVDPRKAALFNQVLGNVSGLPAT